jgi:hypothetical protein
MQNRFVKEQWVDTALTIMAEGLEDTTSASGVAKMAEYELKKTKAWLMLSPKNPEKSVGMREAWALTQPQYEEAHKKYIAAHSAEMAGKEQSKKAESIISAWQTEERLIHAGERIR